MFSLRKIKSTSLFILAVFIAGCSENGTVNEFQKGFLNGYVRNDVTLEYIADALIIFSNDSIRTDYAGRYNFGEVEAGSYTLRAVKEGYYEGSSSVRISEGEESLANFYLVPLANHYSVSGKVVNETTGKGVYKVRVELGEQFTETDTSGMFLFNSIEEGETDILIFRDGYNFFQSVLIITRSGEDLIFPLKQKSDISIVEGFVRANNSNSPLDEAGIFTSNSVIDCDSLGYYFISEIFTGQPRTIKAVADGFSTDSVEVIPEAGKTIRADFYLDKYISPDTSDLYWNFSRTDISHVISIPVSSNPDINGIPLKPGDYVGVFYDSSGVYACAGYITWDGSANQPLTVWGDDLLTSEKEGFEQGESFLWKFKRKSDGINFNAEAEYYFGPSIFQVNGLSGVSSLSAK